MKPGIYGGISFVDYCRIDATNASTLKHHRDSAAAARHAMTKPREETAALMIGHASHTLTLEPQLFEPLYCKSPDRPRRSNDDKAAHAAHDLENADKCVLTRKEWDEAHEIAQAVREHPTASEILSDQGGNEVTLIWEEGQTGTLCKSRIDRATKWRGWSVVADFKTTKEPAGSFALKRAMHFYQWHVSAAFYLDAAASLAGDVKRRFMWIVAHKATNDRPLDVVVYEASDTDIEQGRREYRQYLRQHLECLKTGNWPGYSNDIEPLDLPAYALDHSGD